MRLLVVFLAYLCLSSPALAEIPMADKLCTQSSARDMDISTLLQRGGDFDCSDNKYDVAGPRVWVKIPFPLDHLPAGGIEVQGDNNGLSTMEAHARLEDGTVLSSLFSERELTAGSRPKGNYALPVPGSEDPLIRNQIRDVYIAIDNPKVTPSMSLMQLESIEQSDGQQLPLLVMFALLCGMAIMPLIYNLFFFGAMRYRFMLWHSVMICAAVTYTFSSSGLIFIAFPETSLITKMLLNYWAPAIGVAACGFFLVSFVEDGKIERWLERLIYLSALLPIVVTASVIRVDAGFDMDARNYYHASFIPMFLVVLYAMVHALRRGSKAIWFQIAGWTPIVLFGMERAARGMDLYIGWSILDYGLYFLLVFESVVLALGVAYRVFRLRQTHQSALDKQIELTLLADTDGLTKISNRRSFEREFRRNQKDHRYSHLALLDIDFFKRVNDRYGHDIGDEVLRVVGRQLQATGHFAARIGGEEFALLMRKDKQESHRQFPANVLTEICEMLIKAVHDQVPEIREPVTFSVGVAAASGPSSLRELMTIADRRLYDAKNSGRNRIVWIDLPTENAAQPTGTGSA